MSAVLNDVSAVPVPAEARAEIDAAAGVLEVAQAYAVTSPEMYEAAASELRDIKARFKRLDDWEKSITRPMNAALAGVRAMFKTPKDTLSQAEGSIKRAMLRFQDEQEAKRRKAEAEAQERARKEREKLAARAAAAAEKGQAEKAEVLQMQAETVAVPTIAKQTPTVSGISTREVWSAEVVDIKALCRAIADGVVPEVAVAANMTVLNQQARSLKAALNWPGVRAVSQKSLASGRG